jgi:antirestriction protein ArdC
VREIGATTNTRQDIYRPITDRICADLAQGVRPSFKPWNAEDAAGARPPSGTASQASSRGSSATSG